MEFWLLISFGFFVAAGFIWALVIRPELMHRKSKENKRNIDRKAKESSDLINMYFQYGVVVSHHQSKHDFLFCVELFNGQQAFFNKPGNADHIMHTIESLYTAKELKLYKKLNKHWSWYC